ncbi:bifunctional metallophosphatase/5'-nucleotidase [Vibrio sp. SM6]|uniref:Bifunctional metallophosphatase/5'-nucleotidase n=1 Tax=Vibrio agarilyticus TaxID=2726741 RepID=A0A7X8TR56_9VIBR|nr:bifunctional UDP-sugar hydrolase/5'-nucleotidase [Vibrio agarilyticus]NLS13311.1 bifunctional metallophosphatase/5'-nucleotidase [Vibrio agarilyticus]
MQHTHQPVTLKLAHINDTHSYFEPSSLQLTLNLRDTPFGVALCQSPTSEPTAHISFTPYVSAGGFARIATRVKQLRDEANRQKQGFLFLHAGDCFQGTLFFSLFKGQANAELLTQLGIDAMAVGNHELDIGNEPVAQFAAAVPFPLLAGNWDLSQESRAKPWRLNTCRNVFSWDSNTRSAHYITKWVNGEPVAVFGLSLDKMADIANPDSDTPFVDAIETAKRTVQRIHAAGINKIILLSHLGYDADIALAKQVDGIGVIVGGHSHRLQGDFSAIGLGADDDYGYKVGATHIVQAGYHALTLGHSEIEFAADGTVTQLKGRNELLIGRRMFLDSGLNNDIGEQNEGVAHYQAIADSLAAQDNVVVCEKDVNIQAILRDKYLPQVRHWQQAVIAHATQRFRHVRLPDERGGSAIAPLIACSFAHVLNLHHYDVAFAIHNAGGVRNSIESGKVSKSDIAGKVLPFAVPLGVYDVQGQDIAATLEGAINNALNNGVNGTGSGSFPYTHNLRYRYYVNAPLGKRIRGLSICINGTWQAVEPHQWYRGASSAYTMKGKEGYSALLNMRGEGQLTSLTMADCFIEYLQRNPTALSAPISVEQGILCFQAEAGVEHA